jgi:hypothetical protein
LVQSDGQASYAALSSAAVSEQSTPAYREELKKKWKERNCASDLNQSCFPFFARDIPGMILLQTLSRE